MSEQGGYVCTLDPEFVKKAKTELNENPEDRMAAVQALREWIQEQPHINCPDLDTQTLLRFLRGAKFSQVRAREMFDSGLSLRAKYSKWFRDIDTHDDKIHRMLDLGYMVPIKVRNKKGEILLLQRIGYHLQFAGVKFEMSDMFRVGTILFEYLMSDEMTQVNGMVFLQDFTGVGPKLLSKLMNKDMQDFQKAWVKSTPGRFKGFHYYNAGLVFDTLMAFGRPLFPKKWVDRLHTHDHLESVYKDIPMECLPVEYLPDDYTGPNAGTVDEIVGKFQKDIRAPEFREMILRKTSASYGVDESKRPQEVVTQHFRKLNVE